MNIIRQERSKQPVISIVLYIVAALITLITIVLLVNNVILFKDNVAQYVAQGYPYAEVVKHFIPNQLLPGIFEPIAVYGGIAFLLFGTGIINQKISECLIMLAKAKVTDLSIETSEQVEDVEKISKIANETEQPSENQSISDQL
ncbi:MAG: hypothetical protein WA125_10535 [Desulfosporosinus sp.]